MLEGGLGVLPEEKKILLTFSMLIRYLQAKNYNAYLSVQKTITLNSSFKKRLVVIYLKQRVFYDRLKAIKSVLFANFVFAQHMGHLK